MWMAIVAGGMAWLLVAILAALAIGRAVQLADRRRPRRRWRRHSIGTGHVVRIATGSIPMIGQRAAGSDRSPVTAVRPRLD